MDINLIAPINELGYGYTGLHVCDELIQLGHKVSLFCIGHMSFHPRHEENIQKAKDQ